MRKKGGNSIGTGDYLGIVTFDYINKIMTRCVELSGKTCGWLVQIELAASPQFISATIFNPGLSIIRDRVSIPSPSGDQKTPAQVLEFLEQFLLPAVKMRLHLLHAGQ